MRDLPVPADPNLLVGLITGDDAGVYRLTDDLALVQTVDFFTPIVDDPYLFGAIAAANSLSDVYAMGGKPITVMNILCFPIKERDPNELTQILRGGADKVQEANANLVGGHSVEDPEPKFGLAVTGLVHPERITTNAGAQPGDVIVLTKPLGTGIVTTAAKFDEADEETFAAAVASMATLNAGAAEAMRTVGIAPNGEGVHAATDITGFGLLGHLHQMAKSSGVRIEIAHSALPLLPNVERLAAQNNVTAGGKANLAYVSEALTIAPDVAPDRMAVLADPQTSGGLAICVSASALPRLLAELEKQNTLARAVIGRVVAGDAGHLTIS